MQSKKNDRRVKYTKMVIIQSLLHLMEENPLSKITVTDICKLADINRSTFYTYYTDPYDLLTQIEDELFEDIKGVLENSPVLDADFEFMVKILEYIAKNSALCKIIFSVHDDKAILQRIINLAHDKSIAEYQSSAPKAAKEVLELVFIFVSNGIVGIIQNWIQSNMKQDKKEVAELISKLSNHCVQLYR